LAAATALYRQTHDEIRAALDGLSDEAVAWRPCDGANSIAVLVVHLVASEAETLHAIAAKPGERDRPSEFQAAGLGVEDLLKLLDEADALLDQTTHWAPDLGRTFPLPTLPPDERRPAMTWLIANYGHAREHVGQLLLTKQLALQALSR
jgi:hypothetical protein